MRKGLPSILVTGHSGFVGRNLCRAFGKDYALYGLSRNNNGVLPTERVFSWDQLSRLPDTNVIIHLAGKAHDTKNTTEEAAYFRINLDLTKKIFDQFLQSDATTFIYFSTVKAVADSTDGVALSEKTRPTPRTPYGSSKLAAEQYIFQRFEQFCTMGRQKANGENNPHEDTLGCKEKKVYVLRPCMIHGPGNKGNLNLLVALIKKGVPWPLGAFDNQRSFLSTDNLIFILRQLLNGSIPSGIYHLADDETVSTNELILFIGKCLQQRVRVWRLPRGLMQGIALFGSMLKLPLNRERLKKLTGSYVVSNEKIKAAMRIKNLPVRAIDGLNKTLTDISG